MKHEKSIIYIPIILFLLIFVFVFVFVCQFVRHSGGNTTGTEPVQERIESIENRLELTEGRIREAQSGITESRTTAAVIGKHIADSTDGITEGRNILAGTLLEIGEVGKRVEHIDRGIAEAEKRTYAIEDGLNRIDQLLKEARIKSTVLEDGRN